MVHLPRLSIASAQEWLQDKGIDNALSVPDRELRGCLVAHRGHGFIFLDGTLTPDDERVTLAHEIAHFLRHYERPRNAALQTVGPGVLQAVDGDRPFTPAERVAGVLREVPLGVYQHALGRDGRGRPNTYTLQLETEADLLGFELLAPSRRVEESSTRGTDREELLRIAYGFPAESAVAWARWIDARRVPDHFIEQLKVAAKNYRANVEDGESDRKN